MAIPLRTLPWLLVILSALAPASAEAAPPPPHGGGVVLSGFRLTQDQPDGRRWEIRAREANYDGEKAVNLAVVEAHLTGGGVEEITVRGERGRYLTAGKLLTLTGKVHAVTRMGYEFSSERLEWVGDRPLVKAAGDVRLAKEPFAVKGSSLTYNTQTGITSMTEGVRGTWTGR